MAGDRNGRTEKPTPRRLLRARDEGDVPRSKELPSGLSLAAFLVFCHLFGADWLGQVREFFTGSISTLARPEMTTVELMAVATTLAAVTAKLMFMPVGMLAAAGLTGNLLQGTPPFTLKPLKPDFKRLNPVSGLKKLVRMRAFVDLVKTALKMFLFTLISLLAIKEALVLGLPGAPGAEGAMSAIFSIAGKVIFRVVLLWLVLAFIDLLYTRYEHTRKLMMTKQEVKDERKQIEGDPLIKSRIRSKQLEMARTRMMADVPNATVVITNPTHVAVAVRYVPGETDVPKVLAKGQALIARRIREIAIEHGIPVIQDPPLARALFKAVEVGGYVPVALFRAVAEVLALVMRGKGARATARRLVDEVRP